jgi:hypothetical protein
MHAKRSQRDLSGGRDLEHGQILPCLGRSAGRRILAVRGQAVDAARQHAACQQGIEQRHPRLAGQVVIAGAGLRERGRTPRLAQAARWGGRAEVRQGLDRGGDPVPGQTVVAVAALARHGHQTAPEEPGEVLAGGRRAHPGQLRQFPRGEGPVIEEGGQHGCACWVPHQRRGPRDAGTWHGAGAGCGPDRDGRHVPTVTRASFGPGRSMPGAHTAVRRPGQVCSPTRIG